MRRLLFIMLVSASVLTMSGCACCRQPVATRTTVVPGNACTPPCGGLVPPPPSPLLGAPPPGGVIVPPPPAPFGAPPPGAKIIGGSPSISSAPGNASLGPPRFEANWLPADARAAAPAKIAPSPADDPLFGLQGTTPSPSSPKLYPPEVGDKNTSEPPLFDEKSKPSAPPSVFEKKGKTAFPAGIPQFAKAADGVWGGFRPSIDDGLDWLAANEYRTVLHVRAPGEPETADRKQVERLGMAYVTIEVSPQTLTREKLDEFAKVVGEAARKPLFVYDQDGALAGPLWYLYFRKATGDDDELARIKANRLGLREDREGQHRLMWLAVQQYLQANP